MKYFTSTLQRILCYIPSISQSGGPSFYVLIFIKRLFSLYVGISSPLSDIWDLINTIKVNRVKNRNWHLPCNVMVNVCVFKGSCTAFLLPTHISSISTNQFVIIHLSYLIFYCAPLSAALSPISSSPCLHAALFTVWKCLKLPATTYYKMHSSRAWISVRV